MDRISSSSLALISLVFLLLLSVLQTALCADWRFEACSKIVNCGGEGFNISYPFWIYDKQPSYCGIPGFQLTCKNQQPTFNLSSTTDYIIRHISYENQSFRVIDAKVSREGGCSSQLENVTLDSTPFRYGPNRADLFLFFNCNHTLLPSEYSVHEINCSSTPSNLALLDDDPLLNQVKASGYCNPPVIAPVDRNSTRVVLQYGKSSYYTELLNEGFDLIWGGASDCSRCQRSGGRCGFDWTIYNFYCWCPDSPQRVQCGSLSSLSTNF
ncbi:LEAF RUST 10 DISEASE-RESISTANCE LOCUS RECEPTOR-LIKE PROTEIN KINASE-like 1.2 [Telopea speciosissima]|uniref:LEAF RUST 10 DISEASE-RESISTANCE LOCUS RECEPTOR-LIKE PROTEIN KINASE-like 1.2 n=1 Tax=Telopea speciosissima TaxID=54955 RepID=UPI001CC443D0|nr:LEAF RUST 10 DISEASE-RESISTANCE LOCUS RECEPTOR-LIKE PROTEIN KINASE-like 1.2 [Telopea speciosissima]